MKTGMIWICAIGYDLYAPSALVYTGPYRRVYTIDGNGNLESVQDVAGNTLTVSAALAGHVSLCRLLLESGANVDARDGGPDGITSLMHAALVDDRDLLQLMISFGADVNAKAMGGDTPLMLGALHDHIGIPSILRRLGFDPLTSGTSPWSIPSRRLA